MVRKEKSEHQRTYEEELALREKKELIKDSHTRDKILVLLLDEEMGFDQIVTHTGNARGVINTHMNFLYGRGWVQYKNPMERKGKRRPYCLTPEGKKEAEEILPSHLIRSLSNKQMNEFMLSYKLLIAAQIRSHLVFHVWGNREQYSKQIRARVFARHRNLTNREATEKIVNSIDRDLLSHGFSKAEIVKLWLLAEGKIIADILENLDAPEFWKNFSRQLPPICEIPPNAITQKERTFLIAQIKGHLQTVLL